MQAETRGIETMPLLLKYSSMQSVCVYVCMGVFECWTAVNQAI